MTREDIHKLAKAALCSCEKLGELITLSEQSEGNSQSMIVLFEEIKDSVRRETWGSFAGDSVEFTYDSDGDIETKVYKQGATTIFTKTYNYDVDKNIISIVTT